MKNKFEPFVCKDTPHPTSPFEEENFSSMQSPSQNPIQNPQQGLQKDLQQDLAKHPIITKSKIVNVCFGEGVRVMEPCNLYGCRLDDGVFVGPFVEIQKGVQIGKRTKIQSHSFICELVSIGKDCFVGHGVMFVNDLFTHGAPARNQALWKPTTIGNGVCIGSNATILPVCICDGVVIGAGSVVTKDISQKGIYAGNPARLIRKL